jgi:hypothetical protein
MQLNPRNSAPACLCFSVVSACCMLSTSRAIPCDNKPATRAFKPGVVLWSKSGCFGSNFGSREGLRKGDRVICVRNSPAGLLLTGYAKAVDIGEHDTICYVTGKTGISIYDKVVVVSSDRSSASLSKGDLKALSE